MLFPSLEPVALTKAYNPISRPNVNIFSENFMQLLYGHLNGLLSRFEDGIVLTLDAPILCCWSLGVESKGAFDFVTLGYRRLTVQRVESSPENCLAIIAIVPPPSGP